MSEVGLRARCPEEDRDLGFAAGRLDIVTEELAAEILAGVQFAGDRRSHRRARRPVRLDEVGQLAQLEVAGDDAGNLDLIQLQLDRRVGPERGGGRAYAAAVGGGGVVQDVGGARAIARQGHGLAEHQADGVERFRPRQGVGRRRRDEDQARQRGRGRNAATNSHLYASPPSTDRPDPYRAARRAELRVSESRISSRNVFKAGFKNSQNPPAARRNEAF